MKATRAAVLLAAPEPVVSARVLDGAGDWVEPLGEAGVEVVDGGSSDLVVAPGHLAAAVAAGDDRTALLVGRASVSTLEAARFRTARLLPLPSLDAPTMLVSLDAPEAVRYGVSRVSLPAARAKRARNRIVGAAIARGLRMPGELLLAHRGNSLLPLAVRAAQELGLPDELDWLLVLGRSFERPAFLIFERGASAPGWTAKLSVNRTNPAPDERGLRFAADVGGAVAAHAPRFLGSSVVLGRPMTLETAAPGSQLLSVLRASGSRRRKQALVEAIASWLVVVAAETEVKLGLGSFLDAHARTLPFPPTVDAAQLMLPLRELSTTFAHGELGPEHVIVDGDSFVVIDWEGAETRGLPLADLSYFLARVLPVLDGEADSEQYGKGEVFARLFRGESASAGLLRHWLLAGCNACDIPVDVLGRLLSVSWLAFLDESRRHFVETWFDDPELGPAWVPS